MCSKVLGLLALALYHSLYLKKWHMYSQMDIFVYTVDI
jgi:hypothetical protein